MPHAHLRGFRTLDRFTLADLDSLWNILRGDSVIDWTRLQFQTHEEVDEFLRSQEFLPNHEHDRARMESIQREAVEYLRHKLEYPVPRSVAERPLEDLLLLASAKGHKQVCACVILKVMHIIHHLQARELLFTLPLSDAQVFQLVEAKIYRVIGEMLSSGLPIVQFKGGRKNRDSLYTKLLSKSETIAAQIYDKLRFRIVARDSDDVLPVLNYLSRRLFPFSYVIPGESKNTLVNPRKLCEKHPHLAALLKTPGLHIKGDAIAELVDNTFSARSYRVIHFVVDLPVRVPADALESLPPMARALGPVVFVLTEFQLVDQATELANDTGDASHAEYKERQLAAVRDRLRVGAQPPAPKRRSMVPPKG